MITKFAIACTVGLLSCVAMLVAHSTGDAVLGLLGAVACLVVAVYMHVQSAEVSK